MKICKLTILLFVLPFSACSDDALLVSEKKQKDLVTRTVMGMSYEFESPIELGETYVGDGDEIELCDEGKYNKDLLTSIFINVPTYFTAEKVTLKLHDVIDCFEYDLWEEKLVIWTLVIMMITLDMKNQIFLLKYIVEENMRCGQKWNILIR